MAKPSINDIRNVGDFASSFRWELQFASFPAIGVYPTSESLNIRCEIATPPKATNEKMSIRIRGHEVFQNGRLQYNNQLPITFIEDVDNTIHSMLSQWREACYNVETGAAGSKADVEATILLIRLNNQDEPVWTYKMFGCFLEDYDIPELNADGQDALKPSIILSYDYFRDNAL